MKTRITKKELEAKVAEQRRVALIKVSGGEP